MSNLGVEEQPNKVVLRDGKEYSLEPLDLNIMCDIQKQFGNKPFATLFKEGDIVPLRYLMWLRIKVHHTDITLEQVGHLITPRVLSELQKDIDQRLIFAGDVKFSTSMSEEEEDEN